MLNKFTTWLVNYCLSKNSLSLEERNSIVIHILENLHALPINGIISTNDEGEILLNGRSLSIEQIRQLRESARLALDNAALKVINEQVLYASVVGGLHKAISPEDLYFYRAAIWFSQQLEAQLKILAQREE